MADPLALLTLINQHKADLEATLSRSATAFFSRVSELSVQARMSAGDAEALQNIYDDLLALLKRYPAAAHLLREIAPDLVPAPAGQRSRAEPPTDEVSGGGAESFSPRLPDFAAILPDRPPPPVTPRNLDPTQGGQLAPAVVQRYADVQAPAAVTAEQTFTITVGLKRQPPAQAPEATPLSVQLTDTAAGATGAPLVTVLLYASAFDIIGRTTAQLHVYPDKDDDPATFQLRAKPGISGEQQISISWLQGGINILGRVVATVQVGVPDAALTPYSMAVGVSRAPAGAPATPDPDVILWVDRLVQNGRDYLHFRYMWPQQGQRDAVDIDQPLELNSVKEYAQGLYQQLSACARYTPPAGEPTDPGVKAALDVAERELKKIGAALYEQLFPPKLKAFYKQFAPTAKTILIYSTEPWIPWEILLPNDPDLDDQYCEFLCARFQVARWLIMDQDTPASPRGVPSIIPVRQICPIIPPVGLPATDTESIYLNTLPPKWPPLKMYSPLPRTAAQVLATMQQGVVNLFHIATHGQFNEQNPGAAGILFSADQSELTPDDIFEPAVRRGLTGSSPLVFINACHSGRQALALTGVGGWVDKLLGYGCSGFIGSNWEVQDALAAQFAIAFYEGLRAGKTFGEACLAARAQIRTANRGNSTWLAYVLYAHPRGTLRVNTGAIR